MVEPKFRSYYRRLHHRASVAAMQSLIAALGDHNRTAIAIMATEHADALIKELRIRETPGDDLDE